MRRTGGRLGIVRPILRRGPFGGEGKWGKALVSEIEAPTAGREEPPLEGMAPGWEGGLTTKGCVLYLVYRLYKRLYGRMGPSRGFWATGVQTGVRPTLHAGTTRFSTQDVRSVSVEAAWGMQVGCTGWLAAVSGTHCCV
jgi:hypothetical protein